MQKTKSGAAAIFISIGSKNMKMQLRMARVNGRENIHDGSIYFRACMSITMSMKFVWASFFEQIIILWEQFSFSPLLFFFRRRSSSRKHTRMHKNMRFFLVMKIWKMLEINVNFSSSFSPLLSLEFLMIVNVALCRRFLLDDDVTR